MKANVIQSLIAVMAISIIFLSCKKDGWHCKNGKGSIQTEIRNISGFTAIKNESEAELYITQGQTYEVRVEAQENLLEEIVAETKGDELQIYSQHCLNNHDPIKVYVTLPVLSRVIIDGSGFAVNTNKITGNSLSLTVSGSGYYQSMDSIIVTDVDMSISGSGKIDFLGEALTTTTVVSGSGNITLNGPELVSDSLQGSTLNLTISGSGSILGFNYPVQNCHFTISGSGHGEVNVSTLLDGTLSGSGSLMYKGNPIVNVTTSGSGSVIHVN
ncbi:MAG: DUF2807 domain-containing protein [Chitinophagales bacterium]|nr:DUF2807 domain-containing protein [Chitinophagales bacterium]